mgnify:CR=1 FL=1
MPLAVFFFQVVALLTLILFAIHYFYYIINALFAIVSDNRESATNYESFAKCDAALKPQSGSGGSVKQLNKKNSQNPHTGIPIAISTTNAIKYKKIEIMQSDDAKFIKK